VFLSIESTAHRQLAITGASELAEAKYHIFPQQSQRIGKWRKMQQIYSLTTIGGGSDHSNVTSLAAASSANKTPIV